MTAEMTIDEMQANFFAEYKHITEKDTLTFKKTSGYEPGYARGSSHSIDGNAMDYTLRTSGNFAGMDEYKTLFKYIMMNWPFRAGIDLTPTVTKAGKHPNVHIHMDKGMSVKPEVLPQFFIEDNGEIVKFVKSPAEIV